MRLFLVPLLATLLAGCGGSGSPDTEPPKVQIYVLVDLSETWNNPSTAARNEQLLSEVGEGIAAVADNAEPPVAVQFRVIGQASLGREPLCDVLYSPTLVTLRARRPDYLITRTSKLKHYLGIDCPALIARQPPEPWTEISATIASVVGDQGQSQHASSKATPRQYLIVLSDFKEETKGALAPLPDLSKYHVLLVFRPVLEDEQRPADMSDRIGAWRQRLTERGAEVSTASDTALKRATIASFLSRE